LKVARAARPIPAITIALSAILKVGQLGSSIQSITSPRQIPGDLKTRSNKLPSTPPNSNAIAIAQRKLVTWRTK